MPRQDEYQWDALLTAQEVAARVRVHIDTFQRWCRRGEGPRETRLGEVRRYAESDVRAWLASRQVGPERAEPGAPPAGDAMRIA